MAATHVKNISGFDEKKAYGGPQGAHTWYTGDIIITASYRSTVRRSTGGEKQRPEEIQRGLFTQNIPL